MPQPTTIPGGAKPHRFLLQRIQHAARIAAIASQWTEVEVRMAELLASAFGSSTKDQAGAHHINRNWLALSAIKEAETIRVRLKIIDATLGAILKENNSSLLQEWESLKIELNRRGRERNEVVHGRWSIADEYPNDLILEMRNGNYMRYTVKDFDDILDRVISVWQQCYAFQLKVLEEKLDGARFPGSVS